MDGVFLLTFYDYQIQNEISFQKKNGALIKPIPDYLVTNEVDLT